MTLGTDHARAMRRFPRTGLCGRLQVTVIAGALGLTAIAVAAAAAAAPPFAARDLARQFFGPTFARAEIVSVSGKTRDYRIDEGKVVALRAGALDLLERDGTRQTIRIGAATQVTGFGPRAIGIAATLRGRVVVLREGDGPATLVRPSSTMRTLGKVFLGASLARAEIIAFDGAVHDYRIDEGRIVALRAGGLVLAERDGSRQTVKLASTTLVTTLSTPVDQSFLTRGIVVLTIREGDEAATEVRILSGVRR